jgi:tRNA(Leu) C34 or U34 (ribose-2'-O)-methylase TrmL
MSAASTQRTCGRKPPRAFIMTGADHQALDASYKRNVRRGDLAVPAHARKSMNLTTRKESR